MRFGSLIFTETDFSSGMARRKSRARISGCSKKTGVPVMPIAIWISAVEILSFPLTCGGAAEK
jgi:hypothetical protein